MNPIKAVVALAAVVLGGGLFYAADPARANQAENDMQETKAKAALPPDPDGSAAIVVGGGCFWCVEAVFEELKGVYSASSGYSGGESENPTYRDVCTGTTGHAEVVRIVFDPKEISADDLLRIFFTTHDPTTLNRQGGDVGTQYRSVIFYSTEEEKERAQRVINEVGDEKIWDDPIVTTLEPLRAFYPAEDYHQDYYDKFENGSPAEVAGMNVGYCRAVIEPKVRKFRQKYAEKLRKNG
ncbi:MAG: peptide-methionine (S)-S-oxide reductase MsrA [Fimbriimonadaceae bacterium]|nr:peptide-methionine (S)-S-oxide reductase MsrA [Fimbriimonadaceae bacterium]QYK54751.1 MAG: peptide-methionine (S)-S-oxide reductase MsrA [Fimbriimonadaceae bacterium]